MRSSGRGSRNATSMSLRTEPTTAAAKRSRASRRRAAPRRHTRRLRKTRSLRAQIQIVLRCGEDRPEQAGAGSRGAPGPFRGLERSPRRTPGSAPSPGVSTRPSSPGPAAWREQRLQPLGAPGGPNRIVRLFVRRPWRAIRRASCWLGEDSVEPLRQRPGIAGAKRALRISRRSRLSPHRRQVRRD